MIECTLAYDAMVRIVLENVREQSGCIASSEGLERYDIRNLMLPPLGKLGIVIWQPIQCRPGFRRWRTTSLEYLEQLIDVGPTGKQRNAGRHLGKDTPHGPHIDGGRIAIGAQEKLRRPIPQCDDLIRVRTVGQTR